jgi:hypothetical protein
LTSETFELETTRETHISSAPRGRINPEFRSNKDKTKIAQERGVYAASPDEFF